ncbi:hypothetical protein M0805_006905 [Coniferiporia weirii]|nr:hypothetical protein M0805_006905 [Coniferiporia weirii]
MPPRAQQRPRAATAKARKNDENRLNVLESTLSRVSTPARPAFQPAPFSPLPPSSPPPASSYDKAAAANSADDPFGFFAVETRLKAQKSRRVLQPRATQNRADDILSTMSASKQSHDGREGSGEGSSDGREAFATPIRHIGPRSTQSSVETPTAQSPRVATPRRRRRKTKLSTMPSSLESSPVPQTPSPKKQTARPTESRTENETPVPRNPTKVAGKRAKSSRKKTEETLAEEELASATRELESLLPRRPARRAPVSRKGIPETRRTTRRRVPGAASRGKKATRSGVSRPEVDGEEFTLDGEEREKMEADRAARRDYFRRLDSYKIAEEKVYII